jgi:MarR family transcriptional regulator, multiple antibiotic resistance protein MarR
MADHATLDTVFTDLVRVETRLYNAVAERVRAAAGVGAGHFEFLRYVRDHPDARVADLASAFAIGVGTTSKIVDRLEKEDWVARRPNPANRRSSLLALTPAGETVVSRAEPAWQAAIEDILGGTVTPDELRALAQALGTLRSDLERHNVGLPAG